MFVLLYQYPPTLTPFPTPLPGETVNVPAFSLWDDIAPIAIQTWNASRLATDIIQFVLLIGLVAGIAMMIMNKLKALQQETTE